MKLSLYLDEDTMARSLVAAPRARGADLRTVVEAGLQGKDDEIQLEWAATNGRALYTFNVSDFCRIHRDSTAESDMQASSWFRASAIASSNKSAYF